MKEKMAFGWKLVFALLILTAALASADETKWMAVGMLHDWYSSAGSEVEVGRTHLVRDQQDGLRFPAMFLNQDMKAAKGLWIGTTNYVDPITEKLFAIKVVHIGPRVIHEESEFIPQVFKMYGRHERPQVFVDGLPAGKLDYLDTVDEVVSDLPADRMIYNEVNTAIGLTEKRRIYAYGQQYHNNYMIYDYTFVNTGIIDQAGTKVTKTLEGVVIYWQNRYAICKEACVYGLGILPQSAAWGHNTVNDTMWVSDATNPVDKYLSIFSWQGYHSAAGYDNIGAADIRSNGDGHLAAPQYLGFAVLHADKSAQDHSHDPTQPRTTKVLGSDDDITRQNDQYSVELMVKEYTAMTAGHPEMSQGDAIKASGVTADAWGGTLGGFSNTAGFGPYTIAPGDSFRIVLAEGAAALDRRSCYTIGAKWLKNEGPFVLPNGGTTADRNEYKNAWVYSGRDSLAQTFRRAAEAFKAGYKIPMPPPPPDYFEVTGGGDRIQLKWSASAESAPGFAGYRVFRAMHTPDTLFDEIFACGAGTANAAVVNAFDDVTAQRGFDYYYYVVSFNDGSGNNGSANPSGPLHSSLFFTTTNNPTNLKRQSGTALDQIRVVPNPFNIRARDLQYGYSAPDRIMFLNTPPFCKIKIFTERGDLIEEIDHNNGSGDEAWNSVTSSQQTVVSGIYIAVFEVTQDYYDRATGEQLFKQGESTFRKFVIIR